MEENAVESVSPSVSRPDAWSRIRFHLTFNAALTVAGIGLLKWAGPWFVDYFVAALFVIAAAICLTSRSDLADATAEPVARMVRHVLILLFILNLAAAAGAGWLASAPEEPAATDEPTDVVAAVPTFLF